MMEQVLGNIKDNVGKVMIGKEEVLDLLLASLAAGGHVLLEDVPGTGKTVLAKTLAKSMDMQYKRVQFTPDLLPSDVTGLSFYNQKSGDFTFQKGPVFTNLLLADEINRATPRTQASLLECMAERQVTVDGETRQLAAPFFVIATENPVETAGCFPLPEAQLDRFLMKIYMGNLTAEQEKQLLDRYITEEPLETIESVCTQEEILELQSQCKQVFVHEDLRDYMVKLVQATRKTANVSGTSTCITEGVSPRGTLALLRASQGYALVKGREYVVPEDVKTVAIPVLLHRMISEYNNEKQKLSILQELLTSVPLPTEDWSKA